jgi:hypothetical protein
VNSSMAGEQYYSKWSSPYIGKYLGRVIWN